MQESPWLTPGAFLVWFVIASEAKQSTYPLAAHYGLLRRGACHRARIRATRWLLAMTAVPGLAGPA
jgi:hypothetical protein